METGKRRILSVCYEKVNKFIKFIYNANTNIFISDCRTFNLQSDPSLRNFVIPKIASHLWKAGFYKENLYSDEESLDRIQMKCLI